MVYTQASYLIVQVVKRRLMSLYYTGSLLIPLKFDVAIDKLGFDEYLI